VKGLARLTALGHLKSARSAAADEPIQSNNMPLLGRHKSLPGSGANQSSGKPSGGPAATTARQQPLVCESPLFGVRRQLPVATVAATGEQRQQQKGSPFSVSASASLSSRLGSSSSSSSSPSSPTSPSTGKRRLQHQSSRDGQLGSTLSSIPTQISRQQIHYAFAIMDTNSDGLIDMRDLSQMLANLGVPIDEAILSHVLAPVSKRGEFTGRARPKRTSSVGRR
jgi:hypothetical protein